MDVKFRLLFSHLACSLAVFGSGLSCIYPVISNYLREHYNLTQPQVGTIAITSQIGESLHLPSALTFDSFGPIWTLTIGFVLSASGWTWAWRSSHQPINRQPDFIRLATMFFIIAFGRTYSYCTGFVTMLHNISSEHRGKMTAFLDVLFEAAVLCVFLIYRLLVLRGNLEASSEENTNFLLGLAVVVLALIVVPMPSLRILELGKDVVDTQNDYLSIDDATVSQEHEKNGKSSGIDTQFFQTLNSGPAWRMILSLEYQLLLWGSAISTALPHFVLFNITSITKALNIAHAQRYLLGVYKIGILLSRFLFGYLFDRFSQTKHSYNLFVALSVMGPVSQALFLIPLGEDYFITVAYFVSGVVEGGVYLSAPIFVIAVFGLEHVGRNVSLIYTVKMLLTVALQIAYDGIYDSYAEDDGYCVGLKCMFPTFMSCTALGLLATLCSGVFTWRILKTCCSQK